MTGQPDGRATDEAAEKVAVWWQTAITSTAPGSLALRGHRVQDLIGQVDFVSMVWLMTRGTLPTPEQARLLEAAMVGSVDHGPHAPSIASARMAITCGVGINSAVANGVNVLGDVHGGAGQQCVTLLNGLVDGHRSGGRPYGELAAEAVARIRARKEFVPGFGHRFHPVDPRRDPLLGLVETAVADGVVDGAHLRAGLAVEAALAERARGRPVPMNIDGVTAIVYGELGVPPELARGLFVLSRSVGILAHAWEERQGGRRIKGPIPASLDVGYTGPEVIRRDG